MHIDLLIIAGLDASHPWHPPYDKTDYLESEDADLVVLLKTSAISKRCPNVHINFFPNGGYLQPGCNSFLYPILGKFLLHIQIMI